MTSRVLLVTDKHIRSTMFISKQKTEYSNDMVSSHAFYLRCIWLKVSVTFVIDNFFSFLCFSKNG
jgi:hypothetical protein